MSITEKLRSLRHKLIAVAIVSLAVSFAGGWINSQQFFEAWLVGWFFWLSVSIGCLGYLMIYRLTGGLWGESLERIFFAGSGGFEILLLLFLPLLAGLHALYPWTHSDLLAADVTLRHKEVYLNVPFWIIRSVIYLASCAALSWICRTASFENVRRWSAFGLIVIFILISFASVDWIMSIEPLWYSTVYGLIILTGQGLVGFSFALVARPILSQWVPNWNPPLSVKVLKDQGSLLLTTAILWTYVSFVQWLIIWIGNIPETVTWYFSRAQTGWAISAWIIFAGQFFIPFQLLIFQKFKIKPMALAWLGVFLMLVHAFEVYWLVIPGLHPEKFTFNWIVVFTWIGIGAVWLIIFLHRLRELKPASIGSEYTPLLREALHG